MFFLCVFYRSRAISYIRHLSGRPGSEIGALIFPASLVDADCGHIFQVTVGKTIGNRHFYGAINIVPCGLKGLGNLFPGKTLRPSCKKPGIGGGQVIFPFSPGTFSTLMSHRGHATRRMRY